MEELLKHIGANIKKLRESLGLTQDELASKTTKNKSSISTLENGRGNPALISLCDVAEALGVGVWELFRPSDEERDYPAALLDFQQYMNSTGSKVRQEEMQFLQQLQIGGSPPRDKEAYLLFWLLLKWVTDKDLPEFFKLEVSKVDGDIVGTFKVHVG